MIYDFYEFIILCIILMFTSNLKLVIDVEQNTDIYNNSHDLLSNAYKCSTIHNIHTRHRFDIDIEYCTRY